MNLIVEGGGEGRKEPYLFTQEINMKEYKAAEIELKNTIQINCNPKRITAEALRVRRKLAPMLLAWEPGQSGLDNVIIAAESRSCSGVVDPLRLTRPTGWWGA